MKVYVCKNCGYDVGGCLEGFCPNCNADLSAITCAGCSYSDSRRVFVANHSKCPKCDAQVEIPSGSFGSMVRVDYGRPVTLSASSGVLDVWPALMYFTGISFVIAANVLLFMTYNLEIKSETTYYWVAILSSLGVVALNIVIFGGLVTSLVKDIFYYTNRTLIFSAIYGGSVALLGLSSWFLIALKVGGPKIYAIIAVMLISLVGALFFSLRLNARANDQREALQTQALVKKSVMDLYAGIYNEVEGTHSLKFAVRYDELCVGVPESERLSKTVAVDHNKFELSQGNAYMFTFVEGGDYDLIAGEGDAARYYQKVSS